MMQHITKLFLALFLSLCTMQSNAQHQFDIIALGTGGGVNEANISSYLVSAAQHENYIALDAGTLMNGLIKAAEKGHFDHIKAQETTLAANFLHNHISAYCISHPHLDHIIGMMLAGPFDNHKTILGSDKTINTLMDHVFLSPLWGNFTSEKNGVGKWDLLRMQEDKWYDIPENSLQIKEFKLCHSCPNESSAFLVKNKDAYLLYFGDTGADRIEKSNKLKTIYSKIAPLIADKKLKAIFIEVSFPNSQSNNHLYGHLKPQLLEEELQNLANSTQSKESNKALEGLTIFITHNKPDFKKENNSESIIKNEIEKMNTFGAKAIIIKQSDKYKI